MKKAECPRIDAFELWCWRRLLRLPWTARRSNQSILKEISPGISLEGMMLKLKLQYFGHLMWRVDSLGKTLMQEEKGMTEDEMAGWYHRLNGREFEWTLGVGDGQGGLACCDSWGHKELDMTEWLNWLNWLTECRFINCNNTPTLSLEMVIIEVGYACVGIEGILGNPYMGSSIFLWTLPPPSTS